MQTDSPKETGPEPPNSTTATPYTTGRQARSGLRFGDPRAKAEAQSSHTSILKLLPRQTPWWSPQDPLPAAGGNQLAGPAPGIASYWVGLLPLGPQVPSLFAWCWEEMVLKWRALVRCFYYSLALAPKIKKKRKKRLIYQQNSPAYSAAWLSSSIKPLGDSSLLHLLERKRTLKGRTWGRKEWKDGGEIQAVNGHKLPVRELWSHQQHPGLCRIPAKQTSALLDPGCSENQEPRSLRLLPLAASPAFKAGFNKNAGFAESLFSWRCFLSGVGGWQRLTNSCDLSLVCLLRLGREARLENAKLCSFCSLPSTQTDLLSLSQQCVLAHVHKQAFHKGWKCTQISASLEDICFSPQSQTVFSARAPRCTLWVPDNDPRWGWPSPAVQNRAHRCNPILGPKHCHLRSAQMPWIASFQPCGWKRITDLSDSYTLPMDQQLSNLNYGTSCMQGPCPAAMPPPQHSPGRHRGDIPAPIAVLRPSTAPPPHCGPWVLAQNLPLPLSGAVMRGQAGRFLLRAVLFIILREEFGWERRGRPAGCV